MPPPSYSLRLLGTASLVDATGQPVPLSLGKPFALLAYLALEPEGATRQELAALLWTASDAQHARLSVRAALHTLRTSLACEALDLGDPLRLPEGWIRTDVDELTAALAVQDLETALRLWQGPLLGRYALPHAAGWERWLDERRTQLERQFGAALGAEAQRLREAGAADAACRYLASAVEVQPYRYEHHLHLIEVLLDLRQHDAAQAALARARAHLEGEVEGAQLGHLQARLDALRAGPAGGGGRHVLPLELVGRTQEFAELVRLWRALRGGSGRTALLSGPAGVGKTRLSAELARVSRAEGGTVVEVRAWEAERAAEWRLLIDVLGALYRLPGAHGTSSATDRVLSPLLPPALRSGPAQPAPVSADPASWTAQIADALCDLIAAVAEDAPLLLVLDDLQWADGASRSVLLQAARRQQGGCLLLFTCRSGHTDASLRQALTALAQIPECYRAELGPLSAAELEELLAFLRERSEPAAFHQLRQQVQRLTGGVPLYIVELLKMLQRDGALAQEQDGCWAFRPERLSGPLELPQDLRALLHRRLDRLSLAAGAIAAALAEHGGTASAAALGERARLPSAELVPALDELIDAEIVHRAPDGGLQFSHDEFRRAAAARFAGLLGSQPGPSRVRRRRLVVGLAAVGLLVAGAFTAHLRSTLPPAPPPYGGGRFYLWSGHDLLEAVPPRGTTADWVVRAPGFWVPSGGGIVGPFLNTAGELLWFRNLSSAQRGPDILRLSPAGEQVVIGREGDDELLDVSPDGRFLLYFSENRGTPQYDHDLWISRADGSPVRLLHHARDKLGKSAWSPDGRLIAATLIAPVDTLAVFTPLGERVLSLPFPTLAWLAWCGRGQRLIASVRAHGEAQLVAVDVPSGQFQRLPVAGIVRHGVACSPDGTAIAYHTALHGRLETVVQRLDGDSLVVLPLQGTLKRDWLYWLPDSLPPVPSRVLLPDAALTLRWGERRRLRALVEYSDSSRRSEAADWRALDPAIASVDPTGTLFANREGHTQVVASVAGWHADTLAVRVVGRSVGGALLREDFLQLDRARWALIGWPQPFTLRRDGEAALSLNGDGLNSDGILSRQGFALPRGGTLEVEFRMPLRAGRTAEQRFGVCLHEVEGPVRDDPENQGLTQVRQNTCFGYPANELAKFSATTVHFYNSSIGHDLELPSFFPTDGWTHVALELRADGATSLYLNRRLVHQLALPLRNEPGTRWHVGLVNAATDTEVLVRRLVLWPGTRYGGGAAR